VIADVWTIMWKDWKELFFQRGGMRRGWANLLILIAVFGVFLPYQTGREWVDSPLVMASWAWVPIILVTGVVADAIAGERERHTLETLLASRMPDEPILLGKILAAVGYAWGVSMASLILGVVTVNVAHWEGHFLFYRPEIAVGGALLSLLIAGLAAGAGVLVSLRAQSVRQAQQTLGLATMLLVWIPILGASLLPKAWVARVMTSAMALGRDQTMLGGLVALAAIDAVLFGAARVRFRRTELVLD
jgi:ABC-2 type transport system permease protein